MWKVPKPLELTYPRDLSIWDKVFKNEPSKICEKTL